MKNLIIYAGKSGTTEELVARMQEKLDGETEAVDIKRSRAPDPAGYNRVLVGGAVFAGSINKSLRRYCEANTEAFEGTKLGLFICSLQEKEAQNNIIKNFPAKLREAAGTQEWLGGRFVFADHNFVIRGLMKKITGSSDDLDTLRWEAVDRLVEGVR